MSRCTFSMLLLCTFTVATHGQTPPISPAPIERRAPTTPATGASVPFSNWPKAGTVSPRALLVVTTFDDDQSHLCRLRTLELYRITCLNPQNPATAGFDREQVQSIALAPKGYKASKIAEAVALGGGVPPIAIGLVCGAGGAPICATPTIVGLSLLATGGVLHVITAHRQHKSPRTIYVASPPVTFPDPRYQAALPPLVP